MQGDTYLLPNDWEGDTPADAVQESSGPDYPYAQCTWFAAKRFAELNNGSKALYFTRPNNRVRHAKNWLDIARENPTLGITMEPGKGMAVVFEGGEFAKYGHTGIVEKVNGDGTILVSGYNWPKPLAYSEDTFKISRASGFIYLKREDPKVEPEPKKETGNTLRLEEYKDPRDGRIKPAVTTYNPEVGQNDRSPWIGAAGVRMQEGMIALSGDMLQRTAWDKKVGVRSHFTGSIPFGTTVKIVGDPGEDPRCTGTFVVQDTLNSRYAKPPYKGRRADIFRVHRKDNFSCKNVTLTW